MFVRGGAGDIERSGGELLEPQEVANDKTFSRTGDGTCTFQPAHDADGGLYGDADNVGKILTREANGQPDAIGLSHAGAFGEVHEQRPGETRLCRAPSPWRSPALRSGAGRDIG